MPAHSGIPGWLWLRRCRRGHWTLSSLGVNTRHVNFEIQYWVTTTAISVFLQTVMGWMAWLLLAPSASATVHSTTWSPAVLSVGLDTALLRARVKSASSPAACHYAPVGTTERGVTQSVQDRVDCTVDVAQPVTYHTHRRITPQALRFDRWRYM